MMKLEENLMIRIDPDDLFPFCNTDVICVHEENLNNYVFEKYNTMGAEAISGLAKYICSRSNDDCKLYFKSIGVTV